MVLDDCELVYDYSILYTRTSVVYLLYTLYTPTVDEIAYLIVCTRINLLLINVLSQYWQVRDIITH